MEVRSLLRLRHGLAWHCSTVRIGPLPHLTCHLFNQYFHTSPDCLTVVAFYSCLAGRLLSVSLRWRHSSEIARQMAGWGRDRAGGDFCFSACLTLANNPSLALGTQNSWTPAGEGKTEALTEQFDKYRGLGLKMEPRLSLGVGGIWRDQQIV